MCHVLIIEDEPLLAMMVEDVLSEVGASSFDIADTQEMAIRLAHEHQPALITSDVQLLAGRGPEAVAAIKASLGDIPVIFITGTPEDCRDCDQDQVLAKPFTPHLLQQLFTRLSQTAH